MLKSVPKRPNLEFDRKQAKSLLEAVTASHPEAIARFREHHPRGLPPDPKLADAQLVIAREYGFPSWPSWKAFVETRSLDRAAPAGIALQAICSNDIARARILLRADPELARADGYIACACGELETVEKYLARDPEWVRRAGGVNGWEPIQYACFSRWLRCDPQKAEGIVSVVGRLLQAGADPNASHMITWMGEPWKETVLFAASGIANHAGLTRMLLEAGADVNEDLPEPDPNDPKFSFWSTEVLYHTSEFRNTTCLQLLLEAKPYSFVVSYCLGRALDHENLAAVRLFLEHGADPNFRTPWMENRTHLHRAALNGRSVEIVRALLEAGAEVAARDAQGMTACQYAVRFGRDAVARLLVSHGAREATEDDRALGRIMEGSLAHPAAPIPPEALCVAARENRVDVILLLLQAGASIDACDPGPHGTPPLHWAGWRGRFEAVCALVERGADLHWRNPYGGDALGSAIHGSANCFDLEGGPAMRLPEEALAGDYPQIVEYLISAGAQVPGKIWGGSAAVQEVLRRYGVPDE